MYLLLDLRYVIVAKITRHTLTSVLSFIVKFNSILYIATNIMDRNKSSLGISLNLN